MTKKYKINGKEIELCNLPLIPFVNENGVATHLQEMTNSFETKINELIQAIGEPIEEKKKWDRRELKLEDKYWYLAADGDINRTSFHKNDTFHKWRQESGNCFETKKEAEDYKQKLINENK